MVKMTRFVLMSVLVATMLVSLVAAYGVGMPYWEGYPLNLNPGESKDVEFSLNNMDGAEDAKFAVAIVEGGEFASVKDANYVVGAGEKAPFVMTVQVPKDAVFGDNYKVTFTVKPTPVENAGGVALGLSLKQSFDVGVVEPEPEEAAFPLSNLDALLIAVIVVAVIWMVINYLKKKKIIK